MAIQQDEALNEPLSSEEKPTLYASKLQPSLSQASLNLIVDYKRTLQSELNKQLFWNFKTVSVLVACVSIFLYIKLSDSLKYQTSQLLIKNRDFQVQIFYIVIGVIMMVSICFALIGELTKFLKDDLDSLVDKIHTVFKFDLKEYAQLADSEEDFKLQNKQKSKREYDQILKEYKTQLAKGENTQLIIYRSKPIAVITISKDEELSRDDQYVVKINGISVRRVYALTDLQKDLIQWCYLRARDMYIAEGLLDSGKPLRIFIDVYNFEKRLCQVLKSMDGWQLIKEEKLPDRILGSVFGIAKQTWGIGMNISTKK